MCSLGAIERFFASFYYKFWIWLGGILAPSPSDPGPAGRKWSGDPAGCGLSKNSILVYVTPESFYILKSESACLPASRGGRRIFVWGGGKLPGARKYPPPKIENYTDLAHYFSQGPNYQKRKENQKEKKLFVSHRVPVPGLKGPIPGLKGSILGPKGPIPGLKGSNPGLRMSISGLERTIQS